MMSVVMLVLLAAPPAGQRLVVHEWGTFTSVAASDGSLVAFHTGSDGEPLPSFVYGMGKWGEALVRMETPVVYFYTERELTLTLSVDIREGQFTEWYPAADLDERAIVWRGVRLLPGADVELPTRSARSRYYAARQTDAVPLEISTAAGVQREKLLFYRGIANFTPPIVAKLDGDQVRVTNVASVAVPQVMLFENTGGKIAYQVHGPLDAGTSITLARSLADGTDGGLRRALLTTLVAQGLYDKEASAMLATWDDSWFEPGLRVISIVPAAVTDEVMPMSIEPHPDKIERVLVGRTEIITAELEREVIADMRGIDPPFYANVSAAMAKHGRFAMAALKHVVQTSTDAELRARFPWW